MSSLIENNVAVNVSQNVSRKRALKEQICMVVAEFLGTLILVLFGCMGKIDWIQMPALPILAPLNFGLTVAFVIQIFGHISYAILNPAVSLAAAVHKLISFKLMFFFCIAQFLGASAGYGILKYLTPSEFFTAGLCMTMPQKSVTTVQLFLIEFALTFALVLVVSGSWDPMNKIFGDSAPLRIGFTVVALSFAGDQATGASMNPARSFGPALWSWDWSHQWIYWVAPMCGSACASMFYRLIFWKSNSKE